MSPRPLRIVQRKPADLTPYANNAKIHDPAQVDQIAASILEFGFVNPILLDGSNGVIAGHGRLLAALQLQLPKVPTIELSHLSEIQKRAYILADNRLSEVNTSWDYDLVSSELSDIAAHFDIDLTGFDESFITATPDPGLTDEDEVPEVPDKPTTVLGDVWLMGEHRLLCGDSTSVDAVGVLMAGNKADMVFTDPPYGISYSANRRVKTKKFPSVKNDDKILDVSPAIEMFSRGWVFIWVPWKQIDIWIKNLAALGRFSNLIIWYKKGGSMGDLKKTFSSNYETALVFNRGCSITGSRIGSVWDIGKDSHNEYAHPTQKPVALAEEAIDKTTRKSQIVLDIFGGSGSTLIACEKTGRQCRMMELDLQYCDVIATRWQNYTGNTATLESNGKTFKAMTAQRNKTKRAKA